MTLTKKKTPLVLTKKILNNVNSKNILIILMKKKKL